MELVLKLVPLGSVPGLVALWLLCTAAIAFFREGSIDDPLNVSPRLSIAQTTRAVLLAMATRTTLVGRRASKLSCHIERHSFLCLDQRRSARAP